MECFRAKTRQPSRPMLRPSEIIENIEDLDSGLDTFFRPGSVTPTTPLVSPTSDDRWAQVHVVAQLEASLSLSKLLQDSLQLYHRRHFSANKLFLAKRVLRRKTASRIGSLLCWSLAGHQDRDQTTIWRNIPAATSLLWCSTESWTHLRLLQSDSPKMLLQRDLELTVSLVMVLLNYFYEVFWIRTFWCQKQKRKTLVAPPP